jgi:hypothetical protein
VMSGAASQRGSDLSHVNQSQGFNGFGLPRCGWLDCGFSD